MFWGDEEPARARHSLSNALSSLRSLLGASAIATRGDVIALCEEALLGVDAVEFSAACAASDYERALELYAGPFLSDVVLPGHTRFEVWAVRERARIERSFLTACETRCDTLSHDGRWEECASIAERWLDAIPPSRAAAMAMLNARAAPGTEEAIHSALAAYDALVLRLGREYESPPDARVAGLAAALREKLLTTRRLTPNGSPSTIALPHGRASIVETGTHTSEPTARPTEQSFAAKNSSRQLARMPWLWAIGALAVTAAGTAGYRAIVKSSAAPATRLHPTVAVTNVVNVRSDTSLGWLEDGLKQMIAADLSQSEALDVVPPSRVRNVLRRAGYATGAPIPSSSVTDVARRLGATIAVSAELSKGHDIYVVGLNVFDVASGKLLRMSTVTGPDILSVADAAASRVLETVSSKAGTPHFADIETSSPAAYRHFVRGMQAVAAGQYPDDERELDAALALDPGFVSAITARRDLALQYAEYAIAAQMDSAFARHANRATDWDQAMDEASRAFHGGEMVRAETLARRIVAQYPDDPRGYVFLSTVLVGHGHWAAADSVLDAELALDSLAVEAGNGPCAPCLAYHGLADSYQESGDFAAGVRSARKWVSLQPDLPDAWVTLGNALAVSGRPDDAIAAGVRATALTKSPTPRISRGRWLIMSRRYDDAMAYAATLQMSSDPDLRDGGDDIAAMTLRDKGQLRAANRIFKRIIVLEGRGSEMRLLYADDLARLGDFTGAHTEFADYANLARYDGSRGLAGDRARAFSWPRALEADALAPSGDTLLLRAIADSLETVGPQSYYGRDWVLFHHVRGLIAAREGKYPEAEREFAAGRWGYSGWTRTLAELAFAQLKQGRARDAIATLHRAYAAPPDGMGRYMPRSELDLRMSNAFHAAGMLDSARLYRAYVEKAWVNADPEVKRLLLEPPTV